MKMWMALGLVLLGSSSIAAELPESRLWVPKKKAELRPELTAAATQALESERCVEVVRGQYLPLRSSDTEHHFLITCRDVAGKTYNLGYLFTQAGGIKLVFEQSPPPAAAAASAAAAEKKAGDETSPAAVNAQIEEEEDLLADDNAEGDAPPAAEVDEVEEEDWLAEEDLKQDSVPATEDAAAAVESDDADDNWDTEIDAELDAVNSVRLAVTGGESEGWCRQALQEKMQKMLGMAVREDLMHRHWPQAAEVSIAIPFDAKNPSGSTLRYLGLCKAFSEKEVELRIVARPAP